MRCPTLNSLPLACSGKDSWPCRGETPRVADTMPEGRPWPRITVVTPSYNQGVFIEETIRSVLLQGYANIEYMIIDGGSTDATVEIIAKYQPWLTYCVSEPDDGQSAAINKGWRRCSGEILAWLNADDYYYPGALTHIARLFVGSRDAVMACGAIDITEVDGRRRTVKQPASIDATSLLPWGSVPGQPAVFLRRHVFTELGGLREDLHLVMDWEYWLRIALRYSPSRVACTSSVIAASRDWAGTKTRLAGSRAGGEVRHVLHSLFSEQRLPPELQVLRRHAYARSWWRQSAHEYRAGARWRSVTSLARAIRIEPGTYSAMSLLTHAMRCLTGFRFAAGRGSSREG